MAGRNEAIRKTRIRWCYQKDHLNNDLHMRDEGMGIGA